MLNWSKASARDKSAYTDKCAELLGNIKLPREAVCCCNTSCEDGSHIEDIQCLYSNIVNCLHSAASDYIPSSKSNCLRDKNITPAWNDFVKAAHSEASPETLLNFGLDPVNLDIVRCLKTRKLPQLNLNICCANVGLPSLQGTYARRIPNYFGNMYQNRK